MQTCRRPRSLARFIALWFLLWTGAMLATPALTAPGLEGVCSVGASSLVPKDADHESRFAGHHAQCPACAQAAAPPPPAFAPPILVAPAAGIRLSHSAPDVLEIGSALPPARGPPAAA